MKKLISIIMTIILVFSAVALSGCEKKKQPLSKMNYEYTLVSEDVDKALTLIRQLEGFIKDRDNKKIIETEKQLQEIDKYILHQYNVAQIKYYSDLEDSDAYDMYVFSEDSYMSIKEERMRVLKLLYQSDLEAKETVFADWTKEELKSLLVSSKEIVAIEKEQNELMREFLALDYNDSLEWSESTAEIYMQFVESSKRLALNYDYSNYYDYAASEIYLREYSKVQRVAFRENIKEQILPFYLEIHEIYQDKKGKLTDAQKQEFSSLRKDTCDSSNEYLKGYIESYQAEMEEKMNYLFERNGIIYTESENAYDIAYTDYSGLYNQPYVFLGNGCQDMLTLIHEMGHYISFYHFDNSTLPYDTAEVQSQGNEWLMLKYLEEKVDSNVYEVFMLWRLCYGLEVIITSTFVDEYEELVYTYKNDLDTDALKSIFLELVDSYEGMEYFMDNDSLYEYVQQVTMMSPVYYLSYATSEIAAMTFYAVASEDGYGVAQDMYVDICLETPTDKSFFDTLMDVGLPNPFENDTVERIMDAFLSNG